MTNEFDIPINDPLNSNVNINPLTGLKNISVDLIKKNDFDIRKTIENFFNEVSSRSKRGEKPNEKFGLVAQDLTSLLPYYEELEKLKIGKNISGSSIYDNLIYDNMSQMNEILENYVYKAPDPIMFTPEQETFGIKQALIELQNKLPHIKDKKTREALLWNINKLNSMLLGETPIQSGEVNNVNSTR